MHVEASSGRGLVRSHLFRKQIERHLIWIEDQFFRRSFASLISSIGLILWWETNFIRDNQDEKASGIDGDGLKPSEAEKTRLRGSNLW